MSHSNGESAGRPPRAFRTSRLAQLNMNAMRLYLEASILLPAAMAASLTCVALAAAQNATAPGEEKFDVSQLFATTCGFCHSDGGRAPGRGPQLMNSPRDDDYLRNRIKNGKNG